MFNMKRGIVALVFICILLSLSLVSANIFTDLWNKITGKAVSSPVKSCFDSDWGISPEIEGITKIYVEGNATKINADYCFNKNKKVMEYYCKNNNIKNKAFKCNGGCENGVCISPVIGKECIDSDSGADYYIKGILYYGLKNGSYTRYEDKCEQYPGTGKNNLVEAVCGKKYLNGVYLENHECEYRCENGVCISVSEVDGCNLINQTIKDKIKELQTANMTVVLKEGERVYRSQYLVIPGKIMKVTRIYNDTSTFTGDEVRLTDVLSSSSLTYSAFITAEGIGTIPLDGMVYQLRYWADKTQDTDTWYIILDFPQTTGDVKMTFYCSDFIIS